MRLTIALAVAISCLGSAALAQQWNMPGYSALGENGTVGETSPKGDAFFLKNGNVGWNVKVMPGKTNVTVSGVADMSFIKPRMIVKFKTELDESLTPKDPIKEIEVFGSTAKILQGYFNPATASENNARPIPKPTPGKYEVRGTVNSIEDGQINVSIGTKRLDVKLADKAKITANMTDLRYAQFGDKVVIVAWYTSATGPNFTTNKSGSCIAEKVTVTAAHPLEELGTKKP